jgi:hypothetical protein
MFLPYAFCAGSIAAGGDPKPWPALAQNALIQVKHPELADRRVKDQSRRRKHPWALRRRGRRRGRF